MFQKNKRIENRAFLDSLKTKPCTICAKLPSDPAHIKTVKSGGGDTPYNVLPMCRRHHTQQHAKGLIWMCESYPHFYETLKSMGWIIKRDRFGAKLVNTLYK